MAGTSLSEVERPHDEYPESVQLSVRNVDAWPKRGRLRVQRITTGSAAQTGQRTASGPAARDAAGVLGDPIRIRIPPPRWWPPGLCVGDLVPVLQMDAVIRAVMRWPRRAACARPQAVVARPVAAPRAVAAA